MMSLNCSSSLWWELDKCVGVLVSSFLLLRSSSSTRNAAAVAVGSSIFSHCIDIECTVLL